MLPSNVLKDKQVKSENSAKESIPKCLFQPWMLYYLRSTDKNIFMVWVL